MAILYAPASSRIGDALHRAACLQGTLNTASCMDGGRLSWMPGRLGTLCALLGLLFYGSSIGYIACAAFSVERCIVLYLWQLWEIPGRFCRWYAAQPAVRLRKTGQ